MTISIALFALGIFFLILGLRWQNSPNKELITVLKGMTHLKREISKLEQVQAKLENKINKSYELDNQTSLERVKEIITNLTQNEVINNFENNIKEANNVKNNYKEENNYNLVNRHNVVNKYNQAKEYKVLNDEAINDKVVNDYKNIKLDNENIKLSEKNSQKVTPFVQKKRGHSLKPEQRISPKYQMVLELAASGLTAPEIASRLKLSQDAVNMVLRAYKGETRHEN